jgi:predicted DNA-binding protein (MmcQ/YjbR family)
VARQTFEQVELALREFGMAYPETTEDFPWGHRTLKVKGKAFIFMSREGDEFSLSVKLPFAAPAALSLSNVEGTAYGMARHNWVTASWKKGEAVDVAMVRSWMDESYRAVAPKKVLALLDGGAKTPAAPRPRKAASSSGAKKPPVSKSGAKKRKD